MSEATTAARLARLETMVEDVLAMMAAQAFLVETTMATMLAEGPEDRQEGLIAALRARGAQATIPTGLTDEEAVTAADQAVRSAQWTEHWLNRIEERAWQIRRPAP